MAVIRQKSEKNDNQGICYKLDTEIYKFMSLTFLIDILNIF